MTLEVGEVRRDDGVKKLVICSGCGSVHEISPRTLREQRQAGRLPKCPSCRRPQPIVTMEMRLYWLDRMGWAELIEIAEMIHGPRQRWPEWQARHTSPPPPTEFPQNGRSVRVRERRSVLRRVA